MKKRTVIVSVSVVFLITGVCAISYNICIGKSNELTDELILDNISNLAEKQTVNGFTKDDVANDKNLILVNKVYRIDDKYVPENLITLSISHNGTSESKQMEYIAAKALESMVNSARENGIILIGKSGYRSYATQEYTYNAKVQNLGLEQAIKFSAQAGASEHQTGLAIDLITPSFTKLHTDFQYTKEYKWLINNCADYGFILRYPKGKYDITGYNFEPWHYRYVGVEHARYIMENYITLEEYLNLFINDLNDGGLENG